MPVKHYWDGQSESEADPLFIFAVLYTNELYCTEWFKYANVRG